ncbi:CPBP family intramembrane glutamic endopeptidase [Kitasatospora sp. NPDC059327]|uniref:CPBP family intramembrane glutamic endopeptidase n=1 Tax=Kitasatospora sp. NPDC059327 TaxID=3346803 RepID=UPI00367EB509
MWSHTRSLDVLLLVTTVAPAELVRVATSFGPAGRGERARTARTAGLGVPAAYLAVTGLAAALVLSAGTAPASLGRWAAGPLWVLAAVGAGCALVGLEFVVGAAPKVLRGARGLRLGVRRGPGAAGPAFLVSIALTAVAEEVLYRGLWIGTLHERLQFPAWLAIGCAALGYALGHLFFGGLTVVQKLLSGAVFGTLLTASGSLAVPLAAHLAQNLTVYALARKQASAP